MVRSVVVTSVHSFAVDPARGVFILAILILTTFFQAEDGIRDWLL